MHHSTAMIQHTTGVVTCTSCGAEVRQTAQIGINKEGNILFNHALNTLYFLFSRQTTSLVKTLQTSLYARRKEGNVLFNDALNTFYLRLYGVRHVKNHSDS